MALEASPLFRQVTIQKNSVEPYLKGEALHFILNHEGGGAGPWLNRRLTINIPKQSIIYLVLCLTGILIFVFAGILPDSRTLAELDDEDRGSANSSLKSRRRSAPSRSPSRTKARRRNRRSCPCRRRASCRRPGSTRFPMTFSTAAKMSGMTLVSAIPESQRPDRRRPVSVGERRPPGRISSTSGNF